MAFFLKSSQFPCFAINKAIIPAGIDTNGAIGICPVATSRMLGITAAIKIAVPDLFLQEACDKLVLQIKLPT